MKLPRAALLEDAWTATRRLVPATPCSRCHRLNPLVSFPGLIQCIEGGLFYWTANFASASPSSSNYTERIRRRLASSLPLSPPSPILHDVSKVDERCRWLDEFVHWRSRRPDIATAWPSSSNRTERIRQFVNTPASGFAPFLLRSSQRVVATYRQRASNVVASQRSSACCIVFAMSATP